MPRFAANLSMMFTELPLEQRFAAAARNGFRAIEYLFPYDYPISFWQQQLERWQLELVLFNTAPGDVSAGDWGMAAIPGREAEARAGLQQALAYAQALNCPRIHMMAGVVSEQTPAHQATLEENLRWAADCCASAGKHLLIEALSPQVKPGYFYSSQHQTRALWAKLNHPALFTQLDLYHAWLVDGDLPALIADDRRCYDHVQLASAPGRHEPDRGDIDYPALFRLLDDCGYQGWVGCEYHPENGTEAGLGWFRDSYAG